MYQYLKLKNNKDYPNDRENGWSHELNGVSHDRDNWYFAANGVLWKIPIQQDLNQFFKGEDKSKGILRKELSMEELFGKYRADGFDWRDYCFQKQHMGDIDCFGGYVFVPYTADLRKKFGLPITQEVICMAVFDAETLTLVSTHSLTRHDGKGYSHIWWVAINPNNGLLYTADGHLTESSYIFVYQLGDCRKSNTMTLHSKATLWYETGSRLERRHTQGGCFDDQNYLHMTNGSWTGAGHDYSKGTKGGIAVFRTSAAPVEGGTEKLYRLSYSKQDGSFAFKFSGIGEEPEGLTYWDLDRDQRAPVIRGQLHAIMLDNVGVEKDDFYFKHYRRTQSDHHYQITVTCGEDLGVGSAANLEIVLYGTGKSTPRDTMEVAYNYFEKNWKNTRIVVSGSVGELHNVELKLLKTSKVSKLYIASVDVVDVETGYSYHCPGERWLSQNANSPLTRFFLNAIPSVSNLGTVVLSEKEPRPGVWVYANCVPGSAIRNVPLDKIKDQWQKSRDGVSEWVNVPGWPENPKRNIGVYTVCQEDVGDYLRALIRVDGYEGTLETAPVKILKPTLSAWQSTADFHIKLSPEHPKPGDTVTAQLSSLLQGMKLHYRWRWAGDTSDYFHTRSTEKSYRVRADDVDGRVELEITAEGYDGSMISKAVKITK